MALLTSIDTDFISIFILVTIFGVVSLFLKYLFEMKEEIKSLRRDMGIVVNFSSYIVAILLDFYNIVKKEEFDMNTVIEKYNKKEDN